MVLGDYLAQILIILLFTLIIYSCYVYHFETFLYHGINVFRELSGMRQKSVPRRDGKGQWFYAEKGSNRHNHRHHHRHNSNHLKKYPTLVFLHGFSGDKETWMTLLRHIPKKYHCIAVDLPGHGKTKFNADLDDPCIDGYMKSLKEFLEILKLDKEPIFLIGYSFGGAVAGQFAINYPNKLVKLGLLCPLIKTPIMTEACQNIVNGDYDIILPKNGKELMKMANLFTQKPLPYPQRIIDAWATLHYPSERLVLLRKLLKSFVENDIVNFEERFSRLKSVTVPTVIIWGENDQLLHVSGAKLVNESVKNSKVHIVKNCNHAVQLDKPKEIAMLIIKFVEES